MEFKIKLIQKLRYLSSQLFWWQHNTEWNCDLLHVLIQKKSHQSHWELENTSEEIQTFT